VPAQMRELPQSGPSLHRSPYQDRSRPADRRSLRSMARFRRLAAAIIAMVLTGLCANILGGSATAATAGVAVKDFEFSPARLSVQTGDTIIWFNQGTVSHSVTLDTAPFDNTVDPGASLNMRFTQPGTYAYHCKYHPQMVGTITVVAPGTSTSTTTTTAKPPTTTTTSIPATTTTSTTTTTSSTTTTTAPSAPAVAQPANPPAGLAIGHSPPTATSTALETRKHSETELSAPPISNPPPPAEATGSSTVMAWSEPSATRARWAAWILPSSPKAKNRRVCPPPHPERATGSSPTEAVSSRSGTHRPSAT